MNDQAKNRIDAPETNQSNAASANGASIPAPTLPKGGGAIKGIGEKFSVNAVNGTASFSVPIFTTPSRADFYPKLSISYNSGSGNGPFGLGWNLSVPSVGRKTEKGLPKYWDAEESDVFILSEAEDLVPALIREGNDWKRDILPPQELDGRSYSVQRYRPRIEGLFARIERWQDHQNGEGFWKSISKDNVTSVYGKTASARISDPDDDSRVFKWLLEESHDDKGNSIVYQYKQEDQSQIDRSLPHEGNRLANGKSYANRYLKSIKYGKKAPGEQDNYAFQVIFDYGEHDPGKPEVGGVQDWPCRPDPFSSFRAGFEIRTYRLCQRVLMFHHFAELGDTPCLVRSTDFIYDANPVATFLTSLSQTGYIRDAQASNYKPRSLPPVEFTYSRPTIDEQVHFISSESLENLPVGLDGYYQWIDLDSEGISGVLTEQADALFYKRNLGNAKFGAEELVRTKPSVADLRSGRQQIMDLAGDGEKSLVQFSRPTAGYYERDQEGQWGSFTAFSSNPNVSWDDPNLRVIDLDGDGFSDILVSEDEVFTWYPSLTKEGFGPAEAVHKTTDEEKGPALVFAEAVQSIYLADMTGDGLTDILRIRNGEICYWPNMGYGRFGPKVTMSSAPPLDCPDQFDPRRIRLGDIDGSGTTDLVYLGRDAVSFWFNQSGNGWSEEHGLNAFPPIDNLSGVTMIDLLGNGTGCLVWSSPLPSVSGRQMQYIDLMSGQKPHLLMSISNNMGKQTRLQYAASTKFYLDDLAAGTPWITKLPFPVHVLEQVETRDGVSDTSLVSSYKYHHGYYDGIEREFRGFGLVEQRDAESFDNFSGANAFHVPPVHIKTWFHTGVFLDRQNISRHFEEEYYAGDKLAWALPDTLLPAGQPALTAQEEEEACRTLKGRILRQEIYADDDSPRSQHPYSVSEHNYQIRLIQPALTNRHAVFYAADRESLDYHYERNPADPRIGQQMTLEVDEFGSVTKSAAIGYPRRRSPLNEPPYPGEQTATLITYTESDVTNVPDIADFYRIGVPVETRTYELTGITRTNEAPYDFDAMLVAVPAATEIPYENQPDNNAAQKRLIERARSVYYKDDLSGPLPLGQVESHALLYESYKQAFTPGLLAQVYGNRVSNNLLAGEGKYLLQDGVWWTASGHQVFDPVQFFMPVKFLDPFGNATNVTYDSYSLLVTQTTDPLGSTVSARNDYRMMQPELLTDPNGNRSQVAFDILGMVVGTAVMGKAEESKGDSLEGFEAELGEAAIIDHIANPLANPWDILKKATTRLVYDLSGYQKTKALGQNGDEHGEPLIIYTLARETHDADLGENQQTNIQHKFLYSDGFGREIQSKVQAESGPVDGQFVKDRWVGSGWTIFNNKGKPVRKYEPFFTDTPAFENARQNGVSSTLFYDPAERVVATLHPNHTYEKVIFDPWQQTTWDVNDTVTLDPKNDPDVGNFLRALDDSEYLPTWFSARIAGQSGAAEQDAATKAAVHANTPAVAHLDTLARTFLSVADNGKAGDGTPLQFATRFTLDIEGNQRVVTDARGNQAMVNDFDLLRQNIHSRSVDAGEHWSLNNVAGKPMRGWDGPIDDAATHEVRTVYDELQRPNHLFVKQKNIPEFLADRTVFVDDPNSGWTLAQTQAANLRGKPYQHYDAAGVVTNEQHDFKGNLLLSNRQLAKEYRQQVDWSPLADLADVQQIANAAAPLLELESFTVSATYDALNRPITLTTPDASVVRPTYNEANLLERVDVNLLGANALTPFVINLDYNAKGQRELCEYANGARTEYTYDPLTFRLAVLKTTRADNSGNPQLLQDLSYAYDPAGNITAIADAAQQTIFFDNSVVPASGQYVYDPIYRLIQAEGREHIGQDPDVQVEFDDGPRINLPHPSDGQAMRSYRQGYEYDPVGNILKMVHTAKQQNVWKPSWTRRYEYDSQGNRLKSTSLPGDLDPAPYTAKYSYDVHGNMTSMMHLQQMDWDFKNQLHRVDLGGGGTAYYAYDADGQRVRKVIERQGGLIEERIYLGGFEIFRRSDANGLRLERQSLHVMDDKRRVALVETKTVDADSPPFIPTPLIRYQFDNHLGSAVLELDDAGALISYEEYYPYGSTSFQARPDVAEVSLKRYRYTGKERDEETGLYYHVARYYAPWLSRWLSCDPAPPTAGAQRASVSSPYVYTRCNPTNLIDPNGTDEKAPVTSSLHPIECNTTYQAAADRKVDFARAEATYRAALAAPIAPPDPNEPSAYRQGASVLGLFLPPTVVDFYRKDVPRDNYLSMEQLYRHGGRQGGYALEASINHMAWRVNDTGGHVQHWTKTFVSVSNTVLSIPQLGASVAILQKTISLEAQLTLSQSLKPGMLLHESYFRFSQKSVSDVTPIAASMRTSGWVGSPIEAVQVGSRIIALDNTRLLAAHESGTLVKAVIHDASQRLPMYNLGRFVLKADGIAASTYGEAAMTRIANQGSAYSLANPLGSWATHAR